MPDLLVIEVKLSENEMEAMVRISPGDGEISVDQVVKVLNQNSVVYGINKVVIQKLLEEKQFGQLVVVAQGLAPVPGMDTKVEFFFEIGPREPKPVVLADGHVDHYDLAIVQQVKKGDLLVKMIPPTLGVSGMTVTGRELKTREGRDLRMRAGHNVGASEDGLDLIADCDGCPALIGTKVSVSQQFTVQADVDFSVGNINFTGDVIVRGDVLDGFKVMATGDINVYGNIKNATVEAGGTVNALGGIVAKDKGIVRAGRDINTIFVESATLEAGGSIDVKKAIMHSKVRAGSAIFCQAGKGLIVGGELFAGYLVQAKEIGSEYNTSTKISVGNLQEIKRELFTVTQSIEELLQNFQKLKEKRTTLEDNIEAISMFQPVDAGKLQLLSDLLAKIVEAQKSLIEQLRDLKEKQQVFQDEIKVKKSPKLSVSGKMFPGVEVYINGYKLKLLKEIVYATLVEKEGKIKAMKYLPEEKK